MNKYSPKRQPILQPDGTFKLPLSRNEFSIIDECDSDLAEYNWTAVPHHSGNFYATRHAMIPTEGQASKSVHIKMHRVILERKLGRSLNSHELTDHKNGNTLDNRRANLRVADKYQNARNVKRPINNKHGHKGVSFHRKTKKWQAEIHVNGKKKYLGLFETPEKAHDAYCEAATKYFGEFARFE